MKKIQVKIKKLENFKENTELKYGTDYSSGIDLIAMNNEDIILNPLERALIPTGISIEMPYSFEAQIRSRSGLAIKNGIMVLNSPGTIDNDYRGEIKVILINFGNEPFVVKSGMRVAQMVFCEIYQADLIEEDDLQDSDRGESGFGSTGL